MKIDKIMVGKAFIILIPMIALCSGDTLESLMGMHFPESESECDMGKVCVAPSICVNGTLNREGLNLIGPRETLTCTAPNICCHVTETSTTEMPSTKYEEQSGCGYQNTKDQGFIHNQADRNYAKYGEFPWTLAIFRVKNPNDTELTYNSVGSLLTPQVVLTSASKVHAIPPNELIVRAGAWDTDNPIQLYIEQDVPVEKIITHEKFNNGNHFNNIALLFLQKPFGLNAVVKTICLPQSDAVYDFENCFSTGWGKLDFKKTSYSTMLKKIKLQIVPRERCQENLRKTELSEYFELNESFLCAGGKTGEDMCTGDGGSPLVCPMRNSPKRFYQVGIVSWGISCGLPNVPGVYANVPYLRPWIDAKLSAENVDHTFFTP